jgi:hypothetical protein
MWLPAGAASGLDRMARMSGMTKTAMLAKIITDAESVMTSGMTDEQRDDYFILRSNNKSKPD